jgi:hypothetical protein
VLLLLCYVQAVASFVSSSFSWYVPRSHQLLLKLNRWTLTMALASASALALAWIDMW